MKQLNSGTCVLFQSGDSTLETHQNLRNTDWKITQVPLFGLIIGATFAILKN